jgi:hypothetical protein
MSVECTQSKQICAKIKGGKDELRETGKISKIWLNLKEREGDNLPVPGPLGGT